MSLIDGVRIGSQVPTFGSGPRAVGDEALEVVDLASVAGIDLDPWEQDVLRAGHVRRPDGKWKPFEVAPVVCRQNGKGVIFEAMELYRLFRVPESRLIVHTAHEMKTASEAFRRLLGRIDETPLLSRQVADVKYTNGKEGIETRDGSRIRFLARSTSSARGFSIDDLVLDEAFRLPAAVREAIGPTLAARPNPQIWYGSSAPLPIPESDFLRALIRRGRAGGNPRLAYFEWAAGIDDPIDDPEVWARVNPGYGTWITEDFLRAELNVLDPEGFAREHLGVFPDDEALEDEWTKRWKKGWATCEVPDREKPGVVGQVVLAVDVSPNRDFASVAVAGESELGGVQVEVADHRPGTRWLVPRVKELQGRHGGAVAIGVNSPAWAFEAELKEAGVPLDELSKAEYAQACGVLFDAVTGRELVHLGDPELDAAVGNADRRNYDDAWVWSRRTSSVDISPMVAVTLAHHRARQHVPDVADNVW